MSQIGAPAPALELPDTSGQPTALPAPGEATATVVIWTCNHCPYALAWHDRIIDAARDYADRGVRFLAVNSNDVRSHPEDSFEEMQKRSQEQGFTFDYLYDEPQAVARALGAERTPEVFVYDRERRLRYHGAIDDNRDETGVSQQYLRDALDAVLAGNEPAVADTPPVGCTVKWR